MLKRSTTFLACSMLVFPSCGYSWGNKGHQTVGRIAQLFLQGDNAQATLNNIEEDRIAKQHENEFKKGLKTIYKNPPLLLNLYILISIYNDNYVGCYKTATNAIARAAAAVVGGV